MRALCAMAVADNLSGQAGALSSTLLGYVQTHQEAVHVLLIVIGLIIAFTGRTILMPTVFLLGFLPTAATFAYVFFAFVADLGTQHKSFLNGLAMLASVVLGLLVGIIMIKVLFRAAIFIICAAFGIVAVLDLSLFLPPSVFGANAELIRYCIMIIAGIVAGLCSIIGPDISIILGTSFDGTAIAVYFLASFLGHRPDVFASDVKVTPTWEDTAWKMFYAMLTLLLGTFATVMQYRLAKAEEAAEQRENEVKLARLQSHRTNGGPNRDVEKGFTETDDLNASYAPDDTMRNLLPPTYGTMDSEYSVIGNLGAAPLGGYVKKDTNS